MRRIKARVIRNIGTEAAWLQANPVLGDGEQALVRFGGRIRNKIGNGVLTFSQLSYQDNDLKVSVAGPTFPFISGEGPAPAGVYMANGSGVYNGSLNVDVTGKIVMLIWDGVSKLEKVDTDLPVTTVVNELGQSTTMAISQKVVTDLSGRVDNKVEKVSGKSLIDDGAILKLNALPSSSELNSALNTKVDKVTGKSLVDDTAISKLIALPTAFELSNTLANKVDKETGKGLSANDYTAIDKAKVDKVKTDPAGDANKFLNEKGEYKEVIVPKAPVQSVSVNGQNVPPDANGNIAVQIPDAPVQGITVNGEDVPPNEEGIIAVEIPDAPVQSISLNGDNIPPDSAGNIDINVNTNVEQTVNPLSNDPVASAAVAAALKEQTGKFGASVALNSIGEGADLKYSVSLLDEEGNILNTTDEFSGGGGGDGGSSTTKIVLTKVTQNQLIKEGDEVKLSFIFDHKDIASDTSTGLNGNAKITIGSGASSIVFDRVLTAGKLDTIDVTKFVKVGSNSVRLRVEVDTGESVQVSSVLWSVQVITLKLSSSFDFATLVKVGGSVAVPFNLNGSGTKTVRVFLDGVEIDTRTITSSYANGSFNISAVGLAPGSHSVQMVAEVAVTTEKILKSNSIYFDIAVYNESTNSLPIIAARFDYADGTIIAKNSRPYITAGRFADYSVRFAAYNPAAPTNLVTVKVAGTVISSMTTSFIQRSVSAKSAVEGSLQGQIQTGSTTYTFGVNITDIGIDLEEPTDGLKLKLSAIGRTNNDTNKTEWSFNGITTTFTGVQFAGDGWLENALRLANGGKAEINYKPLDGLSATAPNSFAFTAKIKVSSVTDNTKPLLSCMDAGVGFVIYPEKVQMISRGNSEVSMEIAPEQEYNIAFVSFPAAGSNSSDYEKLNDKMMYLYINGSLSGIAQRGITDIIYQETPRNIVVSSEGATIDLYNVRSYGNYLTDSQVLDISTLDLNDINEIVEKYNFNNVIDSEGNVTVDSVPNDMRYIIITGEAPNGMDIVEYAAAMNDKDSRYNVTEILHVKKSQPSLNWRLAGGCIRLQGTSSLAYPIKNNRIYFKNAQKQPGELWLGCDKDGNGGVLQTVVKWSFKTENSRGKKPAPVDVWCLKADFAESSSSHNTGLARLINDILVSAGILTPAQKYVDPSFAYDVRTTVDGEPQYLFSRKTKDEAPRFVGKFNMNNDKSSESVFGFLDIPGYHRSADGLSASEWITNKFGGKNPTECWEFLNNDFPMGSYLNDDFDAKESDGSPSWMRVFEARFPDDSAINAEYKAGTKKPFYLERFVKWVKSTQNDPAKFKAELADYVDVEHLCAYYNVTDIFAAVDQRVKNQMLAFYYDPVKDKVLGYFILYDNDTINGVRNDGRLKYAWDIDHNTLDPELTASAGKNVYAFAGHDSILWKNLRDQFAPQLETTYGKMRSFMTNEAIFNMFDKEQSGKFAERIYNLDAQYKYIKPKTLGIDVIVNGEITNNKYSYLEAAQGSRSSHRKWWLINRLELFDAKYGTGQYTLTDITWKGISDAGAKITASPTRDFYFEVRREAAIMNRSFVAKGASWSYTYNQTANVGTIFHLYGGKFMRTLDLSQWGGFTDMNLPTLPALEELILGSMTKTYTLSELVIATKLPKLKLLNISKFTTIPTIDLSGCRLLEEFIGRGCTSMTDITLAPGAAIKKLTLPQNLSSLKLIGLPNITANNILFPDGNNVKTLIVENCPLIDWKAVKALCPVLTHIRVTDVNETGNGTFLNQFLSMKGIDEKGNTTAYPALIGTYTLTSYPANYDVLVAAFPLLTFKEPAYTAIAINMEVEADSNVTNLDNNTGYASGTAYVPNGHIKKILDKRYRCLGKQTADGKMNIIKLHNDNSNYFADAANIANATPAVLDSSQGDIFVYEPEFWYKSLSDGDNTYLMVSSNTEKPANPDPSTYITHKLAYDANGLNNADLATAPNLSLLNGFGFGKGQLTIQSSIVNGDNFRSHKVVVTGYKKALISTVTIKDENTATSGFIVFTDSAGIVLSTTFVKGKVNWQPVRKIIDIPANAHTMYFSHRMIMYSMVDPYVVLSNSNNIFDFAITDWSKHEPELIGATQITSNNGKLGSYVSGLKVVKGVPVSQIMSNFLNPRGLYPISYFQHKTMSIMFLLAYGTDNMERFGYSSLNMNYNLSTVGVTAKLGMKDTIKGANGFPVLIENGKEVEIYTNNLLGYEQGYVFEMKEAMTPPTYVSRNSDQFVAKMMEVTVNNGGVEVPFAFPKGNDVGEKAIYRITDLGKFEVIPSGVSSTYRHSNTLNYTEYSSAQSTGSFMCRGAGSGALGKSIFGFAIVIYDATNRIITDNVALSTSRICFPHSDRIVKKTSVSEFTNITNFK